MTMKTLAEVAAGLKTTVATATGLRVFDTEPPSVNPPVGVIALAEFNYSATFEPAYDVPFELYVFVSGAMERVAQASLFDYAAPSGSKSVFAAIQTHPTLGLTGVDAICSSYRPLGIEEVAAYKYFGGVFRIDVMVS